MCYPIPNCDPRRASKPMLTTPTEESTPERRYRDPIENIFNRQGSRSPLNKQFPLHSDSNRPFKLRMRNVDEKEEDEEDYDYPPTDSLAPSLRDFAAPTESSIISVSRSDNFTPRQGVLRGAKQELREMFGIHKLTTDRPQFPFYKDRTDKTRASIHKDKPKNELFSPLKYKTDREHFILPVETTNRVGFSTHKDTTEIQSFSLYKDNTNQEGLTDDEQLEFPAETTDGDTYTSQEDTTYSKTVTDSPVTIEQTISPLWETTTSLQAAWDGVSDSQIHSLFPNTVETDSSKQDEAITRESSKEKAAVLNETTSLDGIQAAFGNQNEHILSSPDPVKQSVTIPTETIPEHGKSEAEREEEHKRLSVDHREPSVNHNQHRVEHIKPLEHPNPRAEHVQTLGEPNTELERKHQWQLFSPVKFSPTTPPSNKQFHSVYNSREEEEKEDNNLRTHSRVEEGELTSNCLSFIRCFKC